MSQFINENWDRKKWYLVRSLFTDTPLLSPIPEIQEPTLQTPPQTEATISRPDSPLPDLIVEKEPNRHDEPEEFYQALEKKIKMYFKKHIEKSSQMEINNMNFSSSDDFSLNTDSFLDQDCNSKDNGEATTTLRGITFNKEEEQEERSSETLENIHSTESIAEFSTTSESQYYEIVVTKALVHRACNEEIDNLLVSVIQANSSDASKYKVISPIVTSSGNDTEDGTELFKHLATEFEDSSTAHNNHEILSNSDGEELLLKSCDLNITSSLPEQPDIMRKEHLSNGSMESMLTLNVERKCSSDVSTDNHLEVRFVRAMEISETSSPEMSVILETDHTSKVVRDRKRRNLSETSYCQRTSPKLSKIHNITVQSSLNLAENREKKWKEIQKNIFEGNPRIFKLCSCINHICS